MRASATAHWKKKLSEILGLTMRSSKFRFLSCFKRQQQFFWVSGSRSLHIKHIGRAWISRLCKQHCWSEICLKSRSIFPSPVHRKGSRSSVHPCDYATQEKKTKHSVAAFQISHPSLFLWKNNSFSHKKSRLAQRGLLVFLLSPQSEVSCFRRREHRNDRNSMPVEPLAMS